MTTLKRVVLSVLMTGALLSPGLNSANSQTRGTWPLILGEAYFGNTSYEFLRNLCDFAGGRIMGSKESLRGYEILERNLREAGYEPVREVFEAPCWERGADEVEVETPFTKTLRASALGFVASANEFTADLVMAGHGYKEEFDTVDVRGKIALVNSASIPDHEIAIRSEIIIEATNRGARAVLFINDRPGGATLSGSGHYAGQEVRIPAYSITMEEGLRLARLLERSTQIKVRIKTKSRYYIGKGTNMIARLPGKLQKKIVVGAHFDSWDAGQGAVDNGQGSGVLLDVARIMKKLSPENRYTVEFVWFDGEELGLIGAKKYAHMHVHDSIGVMINMDMTGSPTGFNVMGTDELVPFFRELCSGLNGFDLKEGVSSHMWTNSDHVPFMLLGVPTITPNAKLDEPMYKYYHDMGDSFDKVSRRYLSDAAAVIGITVMELANDHQLLLRRRSKDETLELLRKHNIESRLKRQGELLFEE